MDLWEGVPLVSGVPQCIRAALMTITADLPAMRKLTQFLGHKANLGCSRCKFCAEREPGTVGASGHISYVTSSSLQNVPMLKWFNKLLNTDQHHQGLRLWL